MSAVSPDSTCPKTICARCGTVVAEGRGGSICPACMAADLAGGEWSDLLAPAGGEMLAGGGFTLMEEIGHGGMGVVYRARQRSPEREVALKLLSPSYSGTSDLAQRLMAEAAMLAEMDHPGILPLYASGVQDGRPWLAMKLVSGGTLAARKPEWRGHWRRCAELAAGLADAVQHAHERGLIHRDLKPGNILFDEKGRAFVADFGLAKWRDVDAGITHTNMVLGTPAYMAPEVARADVRAATTSSDVYGLGAIFYFLLCGQPPFPQAGTLEILRRIADEEPAPPRNIVPDVPGDLQVICLKALSRQPSARYSGPDAMAADLRRWLAGDSIEARPATRGEKFRRWVRRHPLSAGLSAALIVTIAVSGGMLWQKNIALGKAWSDAQRSRDTAYSSMGYLTRDMPAHLEAVGRLDDLDGLFAIVESKLKTLSAVSGDADGADLAYRAELYAHWSRVLDWRGLPDKSREKITQAVQLAGEAVLRRESSPHAWVVLSMSRRLLAEQLFDAEEFEEGRPILESALSALLEGRRRFPDDLGLRVEEAELAHERTDSLKREANYPEIRQAAHDSLKLWTAVGADLNAPDVEPFFVQQWRDRISYPKYYLGVAAEETGDVMAAVKNYGELLAEREKQFEEMPESGNRQQEVVMACILSARSLSKLDPAPIEDVRKLLERADRLAEELVVRDPANLRWRAESASAALSMRLLNARGITEAEKAKSPEECLRRLAPARDSTREHIQNLRIEALLYLAEIHNGTAEPQKRWEDCLAAAKAALVSARPRWVNFNLYMYILKEAWPVFGKDAATLEPLARKLIQEATAAAGIPGASPYWGAVEASSRRRLASLLKDIPGREEEAGEENRKALRLRAGVFKNGPRLARMDLLDPIASSSKELLEGSNPVSLDDAREVLNTMMELAPLGLACGKGGGWPEKWFHAAKPALAALKKEEDRATATAALRAALGLEREIAGRAQ